MKKLLKKNKFKFKKQKVIYTEKKPFLADKEIIFRSNGRAKVFNISHRLQVFMLMLFAAVFACKQFMKSLDVVRECPYNA